MDVAIPSAHMELKSRSCEAHTLKIHPAACESLTPNVTAISSLDSASSDPTQDTAIITLEKNVALPLAVYNAPLI